MTNFTACYLHCLKRKILDDLGNPITSVKYSDEKVGCIYIMPYLEYNAIENHLVLRNPILRETQDFKELKNSGLGIYILPITDKSRKVYRNQKEFMIIAKIGSAPVGAMKLDNFNTNKRKEHKIVIDDANRLVKLVGPNAGPHGEGKWFYLGDVGQD